MPAVSFDVEASVVGVDAAVLIAAWRHCWRDLILAEVASAFGTFAIQYSGFAIRPDLIGTESWLTDRA